MKAVLINFPFFIFQETDYLPVTVLIEDINDHHPQFVGAPYRIRVEELTPPGLTVFRGLQALGIEEYVVIDFSNFYYF